MLRPAARIYDGTYTAQGSVFDNVAKARGWVLGTYNGYTWMDPTKSIGTMINMVKDAVNGYPINGVQFDDHWVCPTAVAGCTAAAMDQAMSQMTAAIRSARGGVLVSLAPIVLAYSASKYNVDMAKWAKNEWVDEVVPQMYTDNPVQYVKDLDTHLKAVGGKLIAGMAINHDPSAPASWTAVSQFIAAAQKKGLGICIWYAKGFLGNYETQISATFAGGK